MHFLIVDDLIVILRNLPKINYPLFFDFLVFKFVPSIVYRWSISANTRHISNEIHWIEINLTNVLCIVFYSSIYCHSCIKLTNRDTLEIELVFPTEDVLSVITFATWGCCLKINDLCSFLRQRDAFQKPIGHFELYGHIFFTHTPEWKSLIFQFFFYVFAVHLRASYKHLSNPLWKMKAWNFCMTWQKWQCCHAIIK